MTVRVVGFFKMVYDRNEEGRKQASHWEKNQACEKGREGKMDEGPIAVQGAVWQVEHPG